ncbi:MAG: hypothetical protein OMM_05909 [Candidatus Magnetoglobus multicellularis str. Araruama]|uniref:Uncharacterized protein n=1 Tax=Candidatus Magnetoglobus multicellularis str. Araruama TaxID=890399 RepID=A0A1V1NTA3_9BACT|nr:MAG: hypothetical protein OMM_05909 [Candidatus Magnetoglobus multicellularis str. Araruama]
MALESRSDCHYITDKDLLFSIEKMDIKPVLLYLNCLNSSAGLINFGLTLSKKVSAFISSRFLYSFDVAQEQGIKLLLDILTKGNAPHRAVSDLFGKLDQSLNIATPQARWMTPLIFRQYSDWIATIPETPARRIHDPHWHLKIDRVSQISTVTFQTLQMLREGRLRCQAFVWYSTEGQGAEKFHNRLTIDLREHLLEFNADFCEVRPEWPSELDRPEIAFKDCLTEAFMVKNLDDIPGAIRKMNYGTSGKQTLIYVRHIPVTSPRLINPKVLKYYLSWWDNIIIPLLERNQFALLGVSFIVKNPKSSET